MAGLGGGRVAGSVPQLGGSAAHRPEAGVRVLDVFHMTRLGFAAVDEVRWRRTGRAPPLAPMLTLHPDTADAEQPPSSSRVINLPV